MFRLTREVRFAVNAIDDGQFRAEPSNSFGGFPSLTGAGQHFALQATLQGNLQAESGYLVSIKHVDQAVRELVIPYMQRTIRDGRFGGGAGVLCESWGLLRDSFPSRHLASLRLMLTPTLVLELRDTELPMVRLSQRFEFAASHRLHNPKLSDAENQRIYGKCNNPHGHGHNYELQVTMRGKSDEGGVVMSVPQFERIVSDTVIERFDHRNLNVELPEFRETIPSVENIARVIYRLLKPRLADASVQLASVTVWETPKTWCEYSED